MEGLFRMAQARFSRQKKKIKWGHIFDLADRETINL